MFRSSKLCVKQYMIHEYSWCSHCSWVVTDVSKSFGPKLKLVIIKPSLQDGSICKRRGKKGFNNQFVFKRNFLEFCVNIITLSKWLWKKLHTSFLREVQITWPWSMSSIYSFSNCAPTLSQTLLQVLVIQERPKLRRFVFPGSSWCSRGKRSRHLLLEVNKF